MTSEIPALDLAILGAGAAGMMAAIATAETLATGPQKRIAIFEKNAKPGIKVLVCGGGRCNFTNDGSVQFLIEQFGRNGRFLTPALQHLDNAALRDFFANLGVPSHVEPGGKVYPNSNQARSVVDSLVNRMHALNVEIHAGAGSAIAQVESRTQQSETTQHSALSTQHFSFTTADARRFAARILLIAVGGMSYQRMGTIGDGYRFAQSLGHSILTPRPAIVGLITRETWPADLPGLAIRDVAVSLPDAPKIHSAGDILLTHFGLSGPAILNPSEIVAEILERQPQTILHVDFARHLSHDAAHARLRHWQQTHGKKLLRKILSQHAPEILLKSTSPDQTAIETADDSQQIAEPELKLPIRLAEKILTLENIPQDQPCSTLTSAQIHRLVERIKRSPFTITATRGFKEAMVTAGGVKLSEVNPRTLESKITPNLFLAGEVLDLTGPSGGYNLQLAFSTGHLAGTTIASRFI